MQQSLIDTEQATKRFYGNFQMQPSKYKQWYNTLSQQHLPYYFTPELYQQWYNYYKNFQLQVNNYQHNLQQGYNYNNMGVQSNMFGYHNITNSNQKQNKTKLSRNQKRKQKKKQLQEEYDKQKKEIGKWVDLQRKDLVQGLKKIQEQQQKIKQKRKEKLSHLIQIHKQVYKHMLKKNKGKIQRKDEIGNFRKKKKKPSHIKRMKQLYTQLKNKHLTQGKKKIFLQQNSGSKKQQDQQVQQKKEKIIIKNQEDNDDDFVTDSDDDENIQIKQQQSPKDNLLNKKNMNNNQNQKKQKSQKTKTSKQQTNIDLNQEKQKQKKQQIQNQKSKLVKLISYKTVGKLNGYIYNGIELRQWVDHTPSIELQDIVLRFINRLAYKQAIKKVNQPEKARKIIIAGLHQCRRTLWTKIDKKKSKLLIVALNIERNNFERGTDDQMQQILAYASQINVPVIHISTRSKIGRAFTGKFGPRITTVSVINYEGYQDMIENIMQEWKKMKKIYDQTNPYCFKF